jgi:hypothetical protein
MARSRVRRLLVAALVGFVVGAPALAVAGAGGAIGTPPDHASSHHGPDGLALDRQQLRRNGGSVPAATYEVDAHAPWTKADWPSSLASSTGDAKDLYAAGTKQVHAIYVYPARSASRLASFGAMFQADARATTPLLRGRALRFDERLGSDGKRYLDITSFQSKYRANQLAGSNQFGLVADEIAAKFTDPNKKYVVWLDAGSQYCGQGTLYQDTRRDASINASNVSRTTAIVYRPYATGDTTTGGFCRGRTLLHELGHNLGALQAIAPSSFDDAHCDDSGEDVMCYTANAEARLGTNADTGAPVFDYGSNDYWDPDGGRALPWWTVNLSSFLCATATSC